MSIAKAFLAAIAVICLAQEAGIQPNSKEFFIGMCLILAGMVAHSKD